MLATAKTAADAVKTINRCFAPWSSERCLAQYRKKAWNRIDRRCVAKEADAATAEDAQTDVLRVEVSQTFGTGWTQVDKTEDSEIFGYSVDRC